jgi:hypothetical protein
MIRSIGERKAKLQVWKFQNARRQRRSRFWTRGAVSITPLASVVEILG